MEALAKAEAEAKNERELQSKTREEVELKEGASPQESKYPEVDAAVRRVQWCVNQGCGEAGMERSNTERIRVRVQELLDEIHRACNVKQATSKDGVVEQSQVQSLATTKQGHNEQWASKGRTTKHLVQNLFDVKPRKWSANARRRRRGSGRTKKKDVVSIFFGNVNKLTQRAEDYMCSNGFDIWLAAETHWGKPDLLREMPRVTKRGWTVTASAAVASDSSEAGTWGGVACAVRSHLQSTNMAGDKSQGQWVQAGNVDLAGRCLICPRGNVLILGGYARGGHTALLVAAVARVTQRGRLPFIWFADFNNDLEHLARQDWVTELQAVVLKPGGGDVSCHQGKGTFIDGVVVSKVLVPYVTKCVLDHLVPFGPHDGIQLQLRKRPGDVMVRSLPRTPKPFPECAAPHELNWDDAIKQATVEVDTEKATNMEEASLVASAMGCLKEAETLSKDLAVWARATELQEQHRRGISAPAERAKPIRFVLRKLRGAERLCAEALDVPGGYGVLASFIATLKAMVKKLSNAVAASKPQEIVYMWKRKLIAMASKEDIRTAKAMLHLEGHAGATAALQAVAEVCKGEPGNDVLEKACSTLQDLEREEAKRDRRRESLRWQLWVRKSLEEGAGAAHKWTNHENAVQTTVTCSTSCMTMDILEEHTTKWEEVWQSNNRAKVEEGFKKAKETRERAMRDPRHGDLKHLISGVAIKEAAKAMGRRTRVGCDGIPFQDVAAASDESLRCLSEVMRKSVEEIALPLQSSMVVMSLLGKKGGDTRTTALCSTYYRLLMALLAPAVREWDKEVATEGDSAVAGKRFDDEAARRALKIELARVTNKHVVMILWDVKKLFDSMEVADTIEDARSLNFPSDPLALGVIMHRGLRAIRYMKGVGRVIKGTGRSYLAGCTLTTSLARARMITVFDEVEKEEGVSESQHVDDVTQIISQKSQEETVSKAIKVGTALGRSLQSKGFEVSSKSKVVGSTLDSAKEVARALNKAGLEVEAATQAEDLGITTAAGARRAVAAQNNRIKKGQRRGRRIGRLARIEHQARKLYSAGAQPQVNYGATVQGVADHQIRSRRRIALDSMAPVGRRPCATTAIAWRYGESIDLAVKVPVEQAALWQRLWASSKVGDRKCIRKAWRRNVPKIVTNKVTWRNVHGPMQATMLTLHRLGWKIPSADMWITPCGNAMANLGSSQSGAKEQILKAVGETAREKGWKEAASHFMGGGLEQGVPALRPAKEARGRLARTGKLEAATALEAVVCGGSWPDGREGTVRLCPCGARDTALHKFWTCPLLDQFTEEEVVKSQWMKKGVEAGDYEECLWGRAILPAGKIEGGVEVDPKEVEVRMTGLFGVVAERTSTIYTDGSGGSAKSSKQCPRHGSGAAAVNLQHDDEGKWTVTEVELMASSVPGRQTVPRAELWAAGACIKATRGEERIEVKSRQVRCRRLEGHGKSAREPGSR